MSLNEVILNRGLKLAMAWGKEWLQPIHSRLAKKWPDLTQDELDECDRICRQAMRECHDFVYDYILSFEAKYGHAKFDKVDAFEALTIFMRTTYPWINHKNLSRLMGQGVYYALK